MNVLVIPEDFRKDQYILQPIVRAMLAALGKDRAKVEICRDPLLGGIDQALDAEQLKQIILARQMVDLFLLCVDRDNKSDRWKQLDKLENQLQPFMRPGGAFLTENAWQEIEVWAIAGHDLLLNWQWAAIRAERDPKEAYFHPLAASHGFQRDEYEGRRKLGLEAARRYQRIHRLCKEDVQVLHARIEHWITHSKIPAWQTAHAAAL